MVNSPDELLSDFLPLLYLEGGSGPDLPKEIVISHKIADVDVIVEAIRQQIGRSIEIRHAVRGVRS